MVSPRRLKLLERLLVVVQGLLAVAFVAACGRLVARSVGPAERIDDASSVERVVGQSVTAAAEDFKPLAWYAPIWERDLRQSPLPPEPTPPPEPKKETKPPPPLPKLLGTFVEGSTGWVHATSRTGGSRVLRLNDAIDGWTIMRIEPGRAQLRAGPDAYWIELPRPESVIVEQP